MQALKSILKRIDGKSYPAYKDLRGSFRFPFFFLYFDHIQGDPFASPSRIRLRVAQSFPKELYATRDRKVALADFLVRRIARAIGEVVRGRRGTGQSGLVYIDAPGQQILPRTAIAIGEDFVEARLSLGLPASGRKVLGREAEEMFFQELPSLARLLLAENVDLRAARKHTELVEDQEYLRSQLPKLGLAAFLAEGSILPRESGVSDRPLPGAVPLEVPRELAVSVELPNRGRIVGLGIPLGVTLIVGGGYHGKSTLLRALERGIYNHIAGDGREFVITDPKAVKIRAEDGRRVEKVDISPFINNLPFGKSTEQFSTEQASGSTSEAANIIEALECGAKVLLLDEDTSATNFMIRDSRMQELVVKEKEPITPFIDKVRQLYEEHQVSTVLVVGGCGDYFQVADTVLMMDEYRPKVATREAKAIAAKYPLARKPEGGTCFGVISERVPLPAGIDPTRGGKVKVKARRLDEIQFGSQEIDLSRIEQLVDPSQTRAIGALLAYASRKLVDGRRSIRQIAEEIEKLQQNGLDFLARSPGEHPGDYAAVRGLELAAALNRLRTLKVKE